MGAEDKAKANIEATVLRKGARTPYLREISMDAMLHSSTDDALHFIEQTEPKISGIFGSFPKDIKTIISVRDSIFQLYPKRHDHLKRILCTAYLQICENKYYFDEDKNSNNHQLAYIDSMMNFLMIFQLLIGQDTRAKTTKWMRLGKLSELVMPGRIGLSGEESESIIRTLLSEHLK